MCYIMFLHMQALCQDEQQRNDVYQLAVNLFDRYLSRRALVSEKELQALTAACAMVSLKIRRARRECLSYYQLLNHFHGVSEKSIMVSCCCLPVFNETDCCRVRNDMFVVLRFSVVQSCTV